MDSHARSVAKAVSWRIIATFVTTALVFGVSYVLVNNDKMKFAAIVGGADAVIKFGAYFIHERVWERIRYGRPKQAEYEI
ncbi:MAG TPA: DUF2061 domain-containing protein [Planctomycetota bacterium]|jgi:uncharacterized membrane protein